MKMEVLCQHWETSKHHNYIIWHRYGYGLNIFNFSQRTKNDAVTLQVEFKTELCWIIQEQLRPIKLFSSTHENKISVKVPKESAKLFTPSSPFNSGVLGKTWI